MKSEHLCSICHAVIRQVAQDSCTPLIRMCTQQAALVLVVRTAKLQPAEWMRWQTPTMRKLQTLLQMGLGLTVYFQLRLTATGEPISWRLLLPTCSLAPAEAAHAMPQYWPTSGRQRPLGHEQYVIGRRAHTKCPWTQVCRQGGRDSSRRPGCGQQQKQRGRRGQQRRQGSGACSGRQGVPRKRACAGHC